MLFIPTMSVGGWWYHMALLKTAFLLITNKINIPFHVYWPSEYPLVKWGSKSSSHFLVLLI